MAVRTGTEFEVPIKATDEASAPIAKIGKTADKTTASIEGLGFKMISLNQAFEFAAKLASSFSAVLESSVGGFKEAEKAQVRLAASLASNGKLTRSALKGWEGYAEQIQSSTTLDDDAVTAMAAKSLALGRSEAQTKKLIETSIELAAATDGDVNRAFQSLSVSLNGNSRALVQYDKRIKGVTDEQSKSGKVLDLLSEKFKGYGKAVSNSLDGLETQARNAFGNMMEEIGRVFTEAFDLPGLARSSKAFFEEMTKVIREDIGPTFIEASRNVRAFFDAFSVGVKAVNWGDIANNLQIVGGAIAGLVVFFQGPALAAALASLASMVPLVASFAAIAGSIGLAAVAIDIFFRNLKKLPKVAGLFADAFLVAFSKINEGLLNLLVFMFEKISETIHRLSAAFPGFESEAISIQKAIGSAGSVLAEEAAAQAKLNAESLASLKKNAEGLDLGIAGALGRGVDQFFDSFSKRLDQAKKDAATDIGPPLPPNVTPGGGDFDFGKANKRAQLFSDDDIKTLEEFASPDFSEFAMAANVVAEVPLGMMAAANIMLDAAQKIIDFIPGILNKAAGVLNSLTALPLAIGDAVNNVFDAVTNFASNFLPNIGRMLDGFFTTLADFAVELPEGMLKALADFPRMLVDFTDRLPDVAGKMAESLAEYAPEIALRIAEVLITRAPEIGARMAWALAVRLPIAIVKGVIEGVKAALAKALQGFAKMFGFKIKVPKELSDIGRDITKGAEELKRAFTGDSSQLFAVSELVEAAKGKASAEIKRLEELLGQAEEMGRSIWESFVAALQAGWDWMKKLGGKIWEGFKELVGDITQFFKDMGGKIWEGLKALFPELAAAFGALGTQIWESFIAPVGEWFGEQGTAIWNGFIAPIGDFFATAGSMIWNGFIMPIGKFFAEAGKAIWVSFTDTLKSSPASIGNVGKEMFDGFVARIADFPNTIAKVGKDMFQGFIDKIADFPNTISKVGKDMFQGFIDKIADFPNTIAQIGRDIGKGFFAKIEDMPNTVAGVGRDIGAGLWGYISDIWENFTTLGANIAVGLWNKIIGFDWGKLVGKSGGGVISGTGTPLDKYATGGVVKMAKPLYAAAGMFVGQERGRDNVPVMAQAGEFIVNARDSRKNIGQLRDINSGGGGKMGGGVTISHLEFNVRSDLDADVVRRVIWPEFERQLKRKSQDGGFVIDRKGVR